MAGSNCIIPRLILRRLNKSSTPVTTISQKVRVKTGAILRYYPPEAVCSPNKSDASSSQVADHSAGCEDSAFSDDDDVQIIEQKYKKKKSKKDKKKKHQKGNRKRKLEGDRKGERKRRKRDTSPSLRCQTAGTEAGGDTQGHEQANQTGSSLTHMPVSASNTRIEAPVASHSASRVAAQLQPPEPQDQIYGPYEPLTTHCMMPSSMMTPDSMRSSPNLSDLSGTTTYFSHAASGSLFRENSAAAGRPPLFVTSPVHTSFPTVNSSLTPGGLQLFLQKLTATKKQATRHRVVIASKYMGTSKSRNFGKKPKLQDLQRQIKQLKRIALSAPAEGSGTSIRRKVAPAAMASPAAPALRHKAAGNSSNTSPQQPDPSDQEPCPPAVLEDLLACVADVEREKEDIRKEYEEKLAKVREEFANEIASVKHHFDQENREHLVQMMEEQEKEKEIVEPSIEQPEEPDAESVKMCSHCRLRQALYLCCNTTFYCSIECFNDNRKEHVPFHKGGDLWGNVTIANETDEGGETTECSDGSSTEVEDTCKKSSDEETEVEERMESGDSDATEIAEGKKSSDEETELEEEAQMECDDVTEMEEETERLPAVPSRMPTSSKNPVNSVAAPQPRELRAQKAEREPQHHSVTQIPEAAVQAAAVADSKPTFMGKIIPDLTDQEFEEYKLAQEKVKIERADDGGRVAGGSFASLTSNTQSIRRRIGPKSRIPWIVHSPEKVAHFAPPISNPAAKQTEPEVVTVEDDEVISIDDDDDVVEFYDLL